MTRSLRPYTGNDRPVLLDMMVKHFNYHRALNSAPEEYWEDGATAAQTLDGWDPETTVYLILDEQTPVGFVRLRKGGHDAAWLEDLYVSEHHRGKGIGSEAMALLDAMLLGDGTTALFVDVAIRNVEALAFYQGCGFDHLNMVQLRKNYDRRLDKEEEVEVLGFRFRRY